MASAAQKDDDGLEDNAGAEDDDDLETDDGSEDSEGSGDDNDSEDDSDYGDESDSEDEYDSEDDDELQDVLLRIERGCTCAIERSGMCKLCREYIRRDTEPLEDEMNSGNDMEYGSGIFASGCGYDDLEGLGWEYNYS